jgi:hypothetical protein
MTDTDGSKMLDSGFYENQIWGALHKAWKGYIIAKNKDDMHVLGTALFPSSF